MQDVSELAASLLKRLDLYRLPVDIFRAAEECGAEIRQNYRLSRAAPGYLFRGSHHPVIVLNGDNPKTRQRFTVGHELWHMLYDDEPGIQLFDTGSWTTHTPWRERSAHAFAQELLMPRELFLAAWDETHSFDTLCRLTGASKQAVNRRMRDLGLI